MRRARTPTGRRSASEASGQPGGESRTTGPRADRARAGTDEDRERDGEHAEPDPAAEAVQARLVSGAQRAEPSTQRSEASSGAIADRERDTLAAAGVIRGRAAELRTPASPDRGLPLAAELPRARARAAHGLRRHRTARRARDAAPPPRRTDVGLPVPEDDRPARGGRLPRDRARPDRLRPLGQADRSDRLLVLAARRLADPARRSARPAQRHPVRSGLGEGCSARASPRRTSRVSRAWSSRTRRCPASAGPAFPT